MASIAAGRGGSRPLSYAAGIGLVLLAGVIWSAMGLGVRLMQEATSFQVLFYRSLGVQPCLLLLIAYQSGGRPLQALGRAGVPSILGGLGLVVAFMGSIISLMETTVANATFLWATGPFFAAILGRIFLGEPVRGATWLAILVAAAGVSLMVFEGISGGRLYGNAAAVVCALGFACYTLALRWEPSGDTLPATFLGGLYCTLASGIAAMVSGQGLAVPVHDAVLAFGLGFVALAGGLALYTFGSKVVPSAELTLLALIEVVLAPIWVWLVVGEKVGFLTLVGGAIVLLALGGNALAGLLVQAAPRAAPRRAGGRGGRR